MGHFVELSSDGALKVVTVANMLIIMITIIISNSSSSSNNHLFLQGIYNCIPETSNVCRVINVAALLWLQYRPVVPVMLFPMINILYFNISTF
jgi:hypothetical protein